MVLDFELARRKLKDESLIDPDFLLAHQHLYARKSGGSGYLQLESKLKLMKDSLKKQSSDSTPRLIQALEVKPVMHPSGSSFALLAIKELQSAREHQPPQDELAALVRHCHLREIKTCLEAAQLDSGKALVGGLENFSLPSRQVYRQLYEGRQALVTESLVFLSRPVSELSNSGPQYVVFPRSDLSKFERTHKVVAQADVLGNLRFDPKETQVWNNAFAVALVLFFLAFLFYARKTLILRAQVLKLRKDKVREQERHAFGFRALAHEMRTPISGIRLSLTEVENHFLCLPDAAQAAVLELQSNGARLEQLSEKCLNLVKNEISPMEEVPLREVLEGALQDLMTELRDVKKQETGIPEFRFLGNLDLPSPVDPYWLSFCFKNLVKNAFCHGTPPVEIHATVTASKVQIKVIDQGPKAKRKEKPASARSTPDSGAGTAVRTDANAGAGTGAEKAFSTENLGIGLEIVDYLARSWRGTFSHQGSQFVLEIPLI